MGSRHRILTIFGTRPEAIKLFPLIHALEADDRFEASTCVTGQHRELMDRVLNLAGITPDHACAVMRHGQTLDELTARLLGKIGPVLDAERPDMVVVQGDTTSAFAGALAAHYRQIPVAHVEAGLRSGNLHHPWPEEFNRKAIAAVAALHFAPTTTAQDALIAENVPRSEIHVTGNTGIDALHWMAGRLDGDPALASRMKAIRDRCNGHRIVGVTCHRRENLGDGIGQIADALVDLASRGDVALIFPIHPNPSVTSTMRNRLEGLQNVELVEPFDYPDFVALLRASHLMLSDSGGVQEEAPAFGTPVLVMRETTERPEGVTAGTARLVGTCRDTIVMEANRLLDDPQAHGAMARAHNPYGDGKAAGRIVEALARYLDN